MSRIGKQPITIPEGVEVKISEGLINIKGPKGELEQIVPLVIELSQEQSEGQKEIIVKPKKKLKNTPALWGLVRSLVFNMVKGVTEGFEKRLQIEGVGYRANLEGNKLVLNIGLSHPVEIEAPSDIDFSMEKNIIVVSGLDKQLVGQVAADIRAKKKPEPYKGKGIRYVGEVVRRKAGKKAAGTE